MKSNLASWLLLACVCALLSACGSSSGLIAGSTRQVSQSGAQLAAPDTTSASGAYQGVSDYRIGAQDLLTITVFGVAELTQDVRVGSTGMISLPLVGTLQAGGKSVEELQSDLTRKLSEGYLQSPQVSVFIKEYTSQRVTVEGSVKKPGIYPLTGKTSLIQVIAIGGGMDDLADPKGVVVFRMIKGQKMAAVFDVSAIRRGSAEDPQVYGDDIVVVDKSGSKSAFRNFIQAVPALGLFRLF